jgi:hypothetical protein
MRPSDLPQIRTPRLFEGMTGPNFLVRLNDLQALETLAKPDPLIDDRTG